MNAVAQRLLADALTLPDADRAELASELIESLDHQGEAEVSAVWAAEIERRIGELDAGAVPTVPWPEARKLIMGQMDEATGS